MRPRVVIAILVAGLAVGTFLRRGDDTDEKDPAAGPRGEGSPVLRRGFSVEPTGSAAGPKDDDLLARARAELADGGLSDATREALLASDDPEHARARRILLAMDGQDATPPDDGPEAPGEDVAPLRVPTLDPDVAASGPTRAGEPDAPGTGAAPKVVLPNAQGAVTPPSDDASVPRPTLRGLALSGSGQSAILTLDAGAAMVVGMANQPTSGIVRLVLEASADPKVLSSRPRVSGVTVSSVRRVGRSVFVTLMLEPGWSLGRIQKTSRGAKVHLRGPG